MYHANFTCFELRLAIALLLISVIVFNLLYNTYLGTVKMENLFAICPSIKHTGLVIYIYSKTVNRIIIVEHRLHILTGVHLGVVCGVFNFILSMSGMLRTMTV